MSRRATEERQEYMNKIILLGNVTRDPETTRKQKEDGSQTIITKFDLAVTRRQKREGDSNTDFFHCTAFGRQAEFVEKYFHSGSRMLVTGRVQNNNYTNKDGNKVYGFNVITEEIEFAQKKSNDNNQTNGNGFQPVGEETPPFN